MKRILLLLALLCAPVFGSTTTLKDAVRLTGSSSPSQWTSNQNNYAVGSNVSVLRVDTDASRNLTGIAGGYDGRVLLVHNVGAQNLVLKDASGSSSSANQFALTGDITLNADAVAILQYDGTSTKWRLAGTSGSYAIDHGGLSGLSDDDHTQYALLAGRSGGQTLIGSTAASENLILKSTSHATEGEVQVKNSDAFRIFDADDTDSLYFSEDGVGNFNITNTTNDIEIQSANDIALVPAGADVQIWDSTGAAGFIKLTHATNGTISTSTGGILFTPNTNSVGIGTLNTSWALNVDSSTTTTNSLLLSSNAGVNGTILRLRHNSASPADNDLPGIIECYALDDGATARNIGYMKFRFDDVTSTTMDSTIRFGVMDNVNAGNAATEANLSSLGVWTDASLAAGKTFEGKMDDVLTKVKNLRIEKYRSSKVPANSPKLAEAERHYSCTAEDFYAAFGLGKDPNAVDADGNKSGGIAPKDAAFLALDCIQKLIAENEALKARVAALEAKP